MNRILAAAEEHGWDIQRRGKFRASLTKGQWSMDIVYSLSRHSGGRGYRGNALSAIFRRQSDIIAWLGAR